MSKLQNTGEYMPSIGRMNRRERGTLGHIVHKERTLASARDKDRLHHGHTVLFAIVAALL